MRNYQDIDSFSVEGKTLYLTKNSSDAQHAMVVMLREGERVAISVSIGSLELALRLRYDDLVRQITGLTPSPSLATTRQVGSGQAFIGLGLTQDGRLIMRPSLVSDATGHITINLAASSEVYQKIVEWLSSEN